MPYEEHKDITTPSEDAVLWRYMDFAQLISLLERKSLWLRRADQFEDPLEGTCTDGELQHFRTLDPNVSDSYLGSVKQMRSTTYVSCWREGAAESMAMWDLYGKGLTSVAIKSNVGLVKSALSQSDLRVFLGKVNYMHWDNTSWDNNFLAMCFRKDSSYQHENEVRAVIWDQNIIVENMGTAFNLSYDPAKSTITRPDIYSLRPSEGRPGIYLQCPPEQFVNEIVLGPRDPSWFEELVVDVLKKYELSIPITKSNRLTAR